MTLAVAAPKPKSLTHSLPDYSKEFILCTDASDIGTRRILMQDRNGMPQPITYASSLCTSAERNNLITEMEMIPLGAAIA